MLYMYAANQEVAFVSENFVAVDQVQVNQLVQFTVELQRAWIQRKSVSTEAVDVVLRGKVTLQNRSLPVKTRPTDLLRQGKINT